jgi:glycosyltransferase involved in cell wall biosynthesis
MGRANEPLKFLDSLAKQTQPAHELIIVDQNEDERLATVDAYAKALNIPTQRIKESIKNLAHARNIGITKSTGDIIGFPDDDCWYEPDVIEHVVDEFNKNPGIDLICGTWLEAPAQHQPRGPVSIKELLDFKSVHINSISIFIRKKAIYELKGFDPRLGSGQYYGAGEESDLVFRLAIKGKQLFFAPQINVHHPYSEVSTQHYARIRAYSRGTGAVYAKLKLPIGIILRGIVAPIIRFFLPPYLLSNKLNNIHQFIGRLEGLLTWQRRFGRGVSTWNNHNDAILFDK